VIHLFEEVHHVRRNGIFIAWLAVMLLLVGSLAMAKTSVFVRNIPFQAPQLKVENDIFVPIDAFLRALGFGWKQVGQSVEILPKATFNTPTITGNDLTFTYKGQNLKLEPRVRDGVVYVSIKSLSKKLGANYYYNKALDSVDVNFIKKVEPAKEDETGAAETTAEDAGTEVIDEDVIAARQKAEEDRIKKEVSEAEKKAAEAKAAAEKAAKEVAACEKTIDQMTAEEKAAAQKAAAEKAAAEKAAAEKAAAEKAAAEKAAAEKAAAEKAAAEKKRQEEEAEKKRLEDEIPKIVVTDERPRFNPMVDRSGYADVTIQNVSQKTVYAIVLTIEVLDPKDRPVYRESRRVNMMRPGEEQSFNFKFNLPYLEAEHGTTAQIVYRLKTGVTYQK
jgi:hypothetical protein